MFSLLEMLQFKMLYITKQIRFVPFVFTHPHSSLTQYLLSMTCWFSFILKEWMVVFVPDRETKTETSQDDVPHKMIYITDGDFILSQKGRVVFPESCDV